MATNDEELLGRTKKFLNEILEKAEKREELTMREKRFLLRTENLATKAIAFPESLTPAERNRVRWMPPPEDVLIQGRSSRG